MSLFRIFRTENVGSMLLAVALLAAPFFFASQAVLAGDSGCQNGSISHKYNNYGRLSIEEQRRQEQQFQAAQVRNSGNQPPSGGQSGGDSAARSIVSSLASILVLVGGVFALAALLRERFRKNYAPPVSKLARLWNFALQPSFALSVFAVLLTTAILGGALVKPPATSAQTGNGASNERLNAPNAPAAITNQPVFKAAQVIGGTGGITQIGAPVFDSAGNRYVRGAFSGTLTVGEMTLTATRDLDLFIAKYDAEGNLIWARQGSGLASAPAEDLAVEGATAMTYNSFFDANQNAVVESIYVAGSFVKTLTLQGGNRPNVTLTDNGAAGYNYESFIAKYDLNGNLLWARGGNSGSPKNPNNLENGQNAINKIVFDNFGTPYVAGFVSGNNFLGTSISSFVCNSNQFCSLGEKSDIIIAKLDKNTGAPERLHVIGGTSDDNALDLAIDNVTNANSPKLYLVGNTSSPQIAFPVAANYQTFTNTGDSINTFVWKLESDNINRTTIDGLWIKVLDNDGIIGVNQIATNQQTGQAFITGYFTGTISGSYGFGSTITNTRTGTGEAALAGYVASLDATNGNFGQIAKLGGEGKAIAIRATDGEIFVAGTLWDTGEFSSQGVTQTLDSFGGNDSYVVNLNGGNFTIGAPKAIAGSGYEGLIAVGNPSAADGGTKNRYSPTGIALNDGRVYLSGDFSGTLSLDCLTLTTPAAIRRAYIAEFVRFDETTTCRIWTNNDPGNRNWDTPDNWNGGVLPADGDSVRVPYRKAAAFNPIFNPSNSVGLTDLSIAADQTLFLQQNLTLYERLDLLGGIVNANSNTVSLNPSVQPFSINNGRVIGRIEKTFLGGVGTFTFPVGTANGYSPVTISSNEFFGEITRTFAVTANQGAYPNTATDLPTNRANRWWNLTNGGLTSLNLTFRYLPGDITTGVESSYCAYRIPTGGGAATLVDSTIDTTAKTVTVPNVTQFSDWTLAQPVAPTAANAVISGRVVTANNRGIGLAHITLTDAAGNRRYVTTNPFGYYQLSEVVTGAAYVIQANHKRYRFAEPSQVQMITGDREDINFIALP